MTSRLTCGYEYTRLLEVWECGTILAMLRAGENIEIVTADDRYPFWHPDLTRCDWCGEEFGTAELRVEGYTGKLDTHRKCGPTARRAFRLDNGGDSLYDRPTERFEPPEINYPNGQGCFE